MMGTAGVAPIIYISPSQQYVASSPHCSGASGHMAESGSSAYDYPCLSLQKNF